ncbi:MAG: TIGR03000 domain-containing protein [Gemmatales bacterium]|nr:TIGR03000 domain-containing protein [Gemmatales bacterium]MDW8385815.1 TIGR03000 domain-containing protein [Gemmatales bacterium]
MKRLLVVILLTLTVWLAHVGQADACRFRWSFGFWYGSWCGPYWGGWYPVYSYWGCGPYWGWSPWYCPVYYRVTPVVYPAGYSVVVPVVAQQPDRAIPDGLARRADTAVVSATRSERASDRSGLSAPTILTGTSSPKPAVGIPANRAKVVVHLPSDARFYVEDRLVKTDNGRREFLTPVLEPGATYRYTFRVEVERDGKTVVQTKEAKVRAGQETVVHFDVPEPTVRVASSK